MSLVETTAAVPPSSTEHRPLQWLYESTLQSCKRDPIDVASEHARSVCAVRCVDRSIDRPRPHRARIEPSLRHSLRSGSGGSRSTRDKGVLKCTRSRATSDDAPLCTAAAGVPMLKSIAPTARMRAMHCCNWPSAAPLSHTEAAQQVGADAADVKTRSEHGRPRPAQRLDQRRVNVGVAESQDERSA